MKLKEFSQNVIDLINEDWDCMNSRSTYQCSKLDRKTKPEEKIIVDERDSKSKFQIIIKKIN